uniref:Glucagon / GIP / secretin / VIP family domain-containing protein n=1 Tax=Oncorhynchus mykiss TaxID=8022 RepID=A0A8K9XAQ3_ONCMY
MARCHRATLVLLVCGILMHYRIYCSSIGLRYPKIRLHSPAWDEDGVRGSHGESRGERGEPRGDGRAMGRTEGKGERGGERGDTLREILGQLTARQYLTTCYSLRMEDESEPLSKRHSDGIFTDGYSRYRKHMAMKKYLEAVLGRRYRQRFRNKVWRLTYL